MLTLYCTFYSHYYSSFGAAWDNSEIQTTSAFVDYDYKHNKHWEGHLRLLGQLQQYMVHDTLLWGYNQQQVHLGRPEIIAKFKPRLHSWTMITNTTNIEKAIWDCLDHFNSTWYMILYYEDIINNNNVLNIIRCRTKTSINWLTSLGQRRHYPGCKSFLESWCGGWWPSMWKFTWHEASSRSYQEPGES